MSIAEVIFDLLFIALAIEVIIITVSETFVFLKGLKNGGDQ